MQFTISLSFGFLGSFYNKMLSKPGVEDDDQGQAYLMLEDDDIMKNHIILRVILLSFKWFLVL